MMDRPLKNPPKLARRLTASLLLACLINLMACTAYTPVRGAVDASAQPNVRIMLSDQGELDVAPRIGLRARQVEGTLQGMTDSSLTLSVRKVSREGGIEDTYTGEQLSLSKRDVDAVEQGRTSVARSALLAAAIVASAFLIAKGAGSLTGSDNGSKPPPTR
jgi:hypothetical protein